MATLGKRKKENEKLTLMPNKLYYIFVYPGANKWAKQEYFTVDNKMNADDFMKKWYKKKRIPKGATYFFHIKPIKHKFNKY